MKVMLKRPWVLTLLILAAISLAALGLALWQPAAMGHVAGWAGKAWQWVASDPKRAFTTLVPAGFGGTVAVFVYRRWRKWRYETTVHMVLIGLPSVGKTTLKELLETEKKPSLMQTMTMFASEALLPKIRRGRFWITATAWDTPGRNSGSGMDKMRSIPAGVKRVLTIVLSPSGRSNRVAAPEGEQEAKSPLDLVDQAFIAEQSGFMFGPVGEISREIDPIRPNLVVIFITKFDLVSDLEPHKADDMRQSVLGLFTKHIDMIASACEEAGIDLKVVVGSASEDWGVQDLYKMLTDAFIGNDQKKRARTRQVRV